jgi:hypothetical protein
MGAILLLGACHAQPNQTDNNRAADAALSSQLADRSEAAVAAADQFAAAAQGAAVTGVAPRQTDPNTARLLDPVFDTSVIPETTRTNEDVESLRNWGAAVEKVGAIYLLAGAGPDPSPSDAERAQIDRNLVTYAPEIGRYSDATVVIMSRDCGTVYYVQATGAYSADAKAQALALIQIGVKSDYDGALHLIARSSPSDAWKTARATVLAQMAPRVAPALDPQTSGPLQAEARGLAAQTNDPALKAQLNLFADRI